MLAYRKPLLTIDEQISHLKDKGIAFNLVSVPDAKEYLLHNNYYFKLTAYRKNFKKYQTGENAGKYIALDFGQLEDLAIIDMHLRYLVVQLALDVEHYLKLELLRKAEMHKEDGYSIVSDFFSDLSQSQSEKLQGELDRNSRSIYCKELYIKYKSELPIWVFLELIPFGRLISFYKFCALRYSDEDMQNLYYVLKNCKEIRNAAAHSSCIINDMFSKSEIPPRQCVMQQLSKIPSISKTMRKKRMKNARIQQIVTLLYAHKLIVTSPGVHNKASILLHNFSNRLNKNKDYYDNGNNEAISSFFVFLTKIIDNWY